MYTLVGLDANLNYHKGITGIGIYVRRNRYMIEGDRDDRQSRVLTRTLYRKLIRKLEHLSIKGPYLFVTWGGPEKACLERHTSVGVNKVIDIEPIMSTLCHTSSLAKTAIKLGIGRKSELPEPDRDAQLILSVYLEMVKVTDNLKWLIDPYRLSNESYLELHRELINSYLIDNLISDKLVKFIYETVPKGLNEEELNVWYNRYRHTMLTSKIKSNAHSHVQEAKTHYYRYKKILSPELKLKDGTHILKTDIQLLRMKLEEDMIYRDHSIPRNMRRTIFSRDDVVQIHREIQEVKLFV